MRRVSNRSLSWFSYSSLLDRHEPTLLGFPVAPLGCRADQILAEALAVVAHPPDASCGYAGHQGKIRHILGHNSSGRDKGVSADGVAAHNRGVRPNGCAAFDQRRPELTFPRNR